MACESCPIPGGCLAESTPAYGFLCRMAAEGAAGAPEVIRSLSNAPKPIPPVYPSLARQVANLAEAAVAYVASGCENVDQAEFDRRRSICLACPTGKHDAAQDRCRACGCVMSIKPWGKAMECPDGHW